MSDIVIRVEGLGKRYSLRHQVRQEGLRHVLQDAVTSLWKPRKPAPHAADAPAAREDFWALRDVSFEVKRGDVVGIIGRNGAGKSTLLKILSRITEPTTGSIEIEGRVASLLEVGTGFHPELTGRENVYLNGAILGMSRAEIRKKFDEIVAFAEVEKFLDTPVKHYSSGMYVRLAFAVAAHLEPEILIVDEVLAVGDAQFQKKCLGKMQDVSQREGRTVLFVSHNMAAVQRLCPKSLLLKKGSIIRIGDTKTVLDLYTNEFSIGSPLRLDILTDRSGSGSIRLTQFYIENSTGAKINQTKTGSSMTFVFRFKCAPTGSPGKVDIGLSIHQADETTLSVFYASYVGQLFETIPREGEFRCHINSLPLREGRYLIGVRVLANGDEADWPRGMIGFFDVIANDSYGTGSSGFNGTAPLLLLGSWSLN